MSTGAIFLLGCDHVRPCAAAELLQGASNPFGFKPFNGDHKPSSDSHDADSSCT